MGDIHGAEKALIQCLERSSFNRDTDTLIQLGDICDGWPYVKETLDVLLSIKNLIPIKGNHDDWFDMWLRRGIHPVAWMHGGDTTAKSYARYAHTVDMPINIIPSAGGWVTNLCTVDIPKSHIDFFGKQHLYYIDEKNRCFVHGGFDREISIKENHESMLYWDRDLWKKAMSCVGDQKLVTADCFSEIFLGHTATTGYKHKPTGQSITTPMHFGGVWNVDTGAGWNGKLTIMDVDTKQYWQSDAVQELYEDERGRN